MEIILNPCTRITTDAIGKPGNRVFYIQGETVTQKITVIIEKIQLQSLATAIFKFLDEIQSRNPNLIIPSGKLNEKLMHILPPVDPIFRVGEIGLNYDSDSDLAIMIINEIIMEANSSVDDETRTSVIQFWCTREQLKAFSIWGLEIVQKGRPSCPLCGEPINPDGHFCPKKNGHNKH
jgi:uncharacterized repeat protein (TIGR03847 family)